HLLARDEVSDAIAVDIGDQERGLAVRFLDLLRIADGEVALEGGPGVEGPRALHVNGRAILLREDDVPLTVSVGVADMNRGEPVAPLDGVERSEAARHGAAAPLADLGFERHFETGDLAEPAAGAPVDPERSHPGDEQVSGPVAEHVLHDAEPRQS